MLEFMSVEKELPKGGRVIARYMREVFGVPTPHYEMAFFERPEDKRCCGWLFWRDNKPIHWPVTHWAYFSDQSFDEAVAVSMQAPK
jgi:hypothetical protein